jgi:hypothetical protein
MDELQRQAVAMWHRWQQLSVGQRTLASTVLLAGAIGLASLTIRSSQDRQPICGGREFTGRELHAIQSAWRQHGLLDFRREGSRLYVPMDKLTQYEMAMPKTGLAVAAEASEWDKQLAKANIFTTSEQLEQLKENALRNEVRRQLKAIPDIAEAEVIWARSKNRSPFSTRSKVTATISVTPRDGFRITPALADSLRTAVAGMVPDLQVADIAVLDQSTGLTITETTDHHVAEQQHLRQQERRARHLESQIVAALAEIPGVSVNVTFVPGSAASQTRVVARPAVTDHVVEAQSSDAPMHWVEFLRDDHTLEKIVNASDRGDDGGDSDTNITNIASQQIATERTLCRIEIQIPQAYLEATAARAQLALQEPAVADDSGTLQTSVLEREQSRIRKLVAHVLPTDLRDAEITVAAQGEPKRLADVAPTSQWLGWPQAVLGLFGLLCTALALRTKKVSSRYDSSFTAESRAEPDVPASESSAQSEIARLTSRREVVQTFAGTAADSLQKPTQVNHDLDCLRKTSPHELAAALRQESSQVIAVLMSRLTPELASSCLSRLPSTIQADVIRRLKSLSDVSEEIVAEIARSVLQRIPSLPATITHESVNRVGHLLPETPRARTLA